MAESELYHQYVTRLTRWVVARRTMDGTNRTVRKCLGVEARSRFHVPIIPEANVLLAKTFPFTQLLIGCVMMAFAPLETESAGARPEAITRPT